MTNINRFSIRHDIVVTTRTDQLRGVTSSSPDNIGTYRDVNRNLSLVANMLFRNFRKNSYTYTCFHFFIFHFSFFIIFSSCTKSPTPNLTIPATPYTISIPPYFPTKLNIPDDNPMTYEGVLLGRYLFYDGRLSGRTHADSLMSCASCHIQKNSFECGLDHPRFFNGHPMGLGGTTTPHFMLPMINLVWNEQGYLWNGIVNHENTTLGSSAYHVPALPQYHMKNIESLVWMGIAAPHEMNGNPEKTAALIQSIEMYPPLFKRAFGSEQVTYENIAKAIAQFVRTLISADSKFDKYLRGEVDLTAAERKGLALFTTESGADCFHCHGLPASALWTTNLFYNNGLDSTFFDTRDRYAVTKDATDKGAYRAPTLRNIGFTAPYMHDGRFKTIDEVLLFYNFHVKNTLSTNPLMHKAAQGGMQLTPTQLSDLKAFLYSLNDTAFTINPAFSNPRPEDPFFID